jgi:YD repeat-containing protein
VPVLAAEAPEPSTEAPPPPASEDYAPSRFPDPEDLSAGLAEAEEEEEKRRAWLQSSEAIQEREESRLAFADLDPAAARDLLHATFAEHLAQLNEDTARVLSDAQLLSSSEPTSATVKDEGDGLLLESSVPVKTENEEGDLRKVDLSLERSGGSYEPQNALVELEIPESVEEPIEVGEDGVGVKLAGADEDQLARPFGDENVFASEVLPDTDMLISPVASGVEVFNVLRSENSPETIRFQVQMPPGAELRNDDGWGAEVVKGGEALTMIREPVAVDAQGTDVPVEMEVEGDSLVLRVEHREGDYAMPILLDPILEDNGNWIYGQNHNALDMGMWGYWNGGSWWFHGSTYCIYQCFGPGGAGTRGLFVSLEGQRSYGAGQQGHWVYNAPYNAFVSRATMGPPYVWDVHGCAESQYSQPHNYFGLWSYGWSTWTALSTYSANQPGGSWTLDQRGDAVIVGLSTGGGISWLPCWRDLYVGGASMWLDDDNWPSVYSVQDPPTTWVNASTSIKVIAQASDAGLGVQNVSLSSEGSPTYLADPTQCSGTRRDPCLTGHTATFNLSGAHFREGRRPAAVTAYDPTGKFSNAYYFETKMDAGAPEVTLDGQLAQETEEAGPVEQAPGKGDELKLPVYNLKIDARDEAPGDTEADWRSGVRDIEVYLDDVEQEVPWSPAASCAHDCPMTQTYKLKLNKLATEGQLDTSGKHTLKILVWDFAGNVRKRDIEFEYFPATGMKDEYVMQYFPLPDGSGNEAEEEHPERPELAVNVMNGNLIYRETDIDVEGSAGVDLEVERYYNSQLPSAEDSELGDGWTLAQAPDLDPIVDNGREGEASEEAEGRDSSGAIEGGIELPVQAGASKFDPEMQATVTKKPDGGYELTDETGESAETVVFDETGQPEALLGPGESKVDFDYEAGKLAEIEVSDPATFSADPAELGIPEPQLIAEPVYASAFGVNGTADGELKSPGDVALDAQGNLLVVDTANDRVQKFDPTGKFLAKFGSAGSGDGQINRPTAIAVGPNGDVYVADAGNSRIQRFSSAGAFLSKFGSVGTGNGQFSGSGPEGIALDAAGNIWVTDTYGGRLEQFSAAGVFLQAVGTKGSGGGQLGEPTGIDISPNGDILVADRQNDSVSAFDSGGAFLGRAGSAGSGDTEFDEPVEVEIDELGNSWVADRGNSRVQQLDLDGHFKGNFGTAGSGPGQFNLSSPTGIAADSKGHLWVTDANNHRLQQWLVPIERPAYISAFGSQGSGDGQMAAPAAVTMGIEGSLWVVDQNNNRVQKFDRSGKFLAKFGSLGSGDGQFNRPTAVAVDLDGNLLVVDADNNRVQKFDQSGNFLAKFGTAGTGEGQLSSPEGIATDFEGNVWVADSGNNRVQKFDENGEFLGFSIGQLGRPIGVDIDPDGNVWVSELQKNRVSVFEPDGDFLGQLGGLGSDPGRFNRPSAVEIDDKGNVWVADQNNQRVQRFDLEGDYVGQFGAEGSDEGQFAFPTAETPVGIATDDEGRIFVTDVNNHRIQRWQIGHYQPPVAEPLDLSDGDPKVEVETDAGLVTEVAGAAAGTHEYSHSGDDLTAHDGPEGETKYEYDGAGKMTKVTLPNGTWGEIAYYPDARVKSVTVQAAGSPSPKTTEFEYQEEPRRTTVVPPDAPHVTYDIGEDGSVFKWWNTLSPPTIEPLLGNLYGSRETADPVAPGVYYLTARAWSAEGIASIDIILDGNQLVDEMNCAQDPEVPGLECVNPPRENEWVLETDETTPGIHWVEVLVTDRLGASASQRFWVNIPQPPPPPIGAPVPPRFKDIKKFREDYGLEVVFPVANEIKLNERIFDLIGAWYNPNSPAGQVARASWERWGVPLRPEDVAELEYRERYIEQNGPRIKQWGEDNYPNSYAGYWVDHRAGGIIRVGFTADQANRVAALAQSGILEATDRLQPYASTPAFAFSELISLQLAIGVQDAGQGPLAGQVRRVGVDVSSNTVTVGASNVGAVDSGLKSHYGGSAPISVSFDPGTGGPTSAHITENGPLKAGHLIAAYLKEVEGEKKYNVCTAGPLAWERVGSAKPNGEAKIANFMITAGHCAEEGKPVFRVKAVTKEGVDVGFKIGEQRTRKWQIYEEIDRFETDGEAVRLDGPVPLAARIVGGGSVGGKAQIEIGRTVCESLGFSERVACQPIKELPEIMPYYGEHFPHSGPFWQAKVNINVIGGDSGAPVYYQNSKEVVGINVFGPPSQITPLLAPPLPEEGSYPWFKPSRDQAPGLLNEPFMGDLNILKE